MRNLAGILFICVACICQVKAQVNQNRPTGDSLSRSRIDTIKPAAYINVGKIAARKAAIQSAMLPGLGQINNKVTFWSVGKVVAFYGGFAALTLSYMDNTDNYKIFLSELQYRAANGGKSNPASLYASYPTEGLITAKDVFRRNREVIIFSYVGVYALNIVDAYIAARLKYFNVDEQLAFKISPGIVNTPTMHAFNIVPSIKLTLKL